MSGKIPRTVLSDKDAILSQVISSELPKTQHRVCTWQIYQNALKHLNQVVAGSDSFSSDLCGCFLHSDEEDFVNSWKVMLDAYSLWENEWLHGVFEERVKWALPYSKHIFSADIETTFLSECSIASLKKYVKHESHILQFVKHFGRVVSEIYTPIILKAFHQEYENSLNIVINQCMDAMSSVEYKVSTYGEVRHYTVLYSLEDDLVACNCSEVLRNLLWLITFFLDKFLETLLLAMILGGGGGGGIEMVPCFWFEMLLPSTAVCSCTAGGYTTLKSKSGKGRALKQRLQLSFLNSFPAFSYKKNQSLCPFRTGTGTTDATIIRKDVKLALTSQPLMSFAASSAPLLH
ncbi:hypothetical protein SASPL_118329 [Salvia splendens]|uniref:Protein FAR1-RELATED SEQUENCE n=1 Tax=Salvia splendens TaxID=180675 RepID=A0A8X8ZX51_SALSN|nr:hypothetical protein SASPL_118329 [Salvia splendens]